LELLNSNNGKSFDAMPKDAMPCPRLTENAYTGLPNTPAMPGKKLDIGAVASKS
jgi:hypothetical protein